MDEWWRNVGSWVVCEWKGCRRSRVRCCEEGGGDESVDGAGVGSP